GARCARKPAGRDRPYRGHGADPPGSLPPRGRRRGRADLRAPLSDPLDEAGGELDARLERLDLDPLVRRVVGAANRPEPVDRGDAVVAGPAAVRDAARVLLADLEA